MKHKLQNLLKHKLQWLLLLAALLGVSQGVWGDNEYNRKYLYIDARDQTWYYNDGCTVYMNVFSDYACNSWIANATDLPRLTGDFTNVSYCDVDSHGGKSKARGFKTARCSGWYNQYSRGVENGQTHNCLRITDNQGSNEWTTFVLEPTSVSLEITGSFAGSGTSADPYLVRSGNNFTLTATPTYDISDPDMATRYKIDTSENNTPSETSNTVTITANWEVGTTRHYYVSARGYYTPGSAYTNPATHVTDDIYVQVAADYYVTGNGNANGWCDNKSWDAAGSPMTSLGGNVYAKTFTNVTVANNLQFKVTDGTWTNTYGWSDVDISSCTPAAMQSKVTSAGSDNNINLNTSETSYTIITIKFNSSTHKVWVEFAEAPKFKEGQLLWLDLRGSSYGSASGEKIYASFYYSSSWHRQLMTLVAKGDGTYTEHGLYVYRVTAEDESNNPSKMRFERGPADGGGSWNNSKELSTSDLSDYNGMLINVGGGTSWDNVGDKYAFSPTNVVVSTPTLKMKNSDGSLIITECMAGETVLFVESGKNIDVTLGASTKTRTLSSPRYRYTFVDSDNYQSSWLSTEPPHSWTTVAANVASGDAKVELTFPVDGSGNLAGAINSGYEKTGSTSFTVNSACVDPNIVTNLNPSTSWSKCGNAEGRQLSITASGGSGTLTYQWFRNTTNTLTDGVADLTGATAVTDMVEGGNTYSPSASDYGKFYYCCVVRSGGACSANKATSVYTGEIEIKQTPTVKPSTITVKQYEPVRLQATNSSVNWSITTHPDGAAADEYYLYDETKNSAMFKGKTGSYTITATSTGSDCTSTSAITVENDPNTCN